MVALHWTITFLIIDVLIDVVRPDVNMKFLNNNAPVVKIRMGSQQIKRQAIIKCCGNKSCKNWRRKNTKTPAADELVTRNKNGKTKPSFPDTSITDEINDQESYTDHSFHFQYSDPDSNLKASQSPGGEFQLPNLSEKTKTSYSKIKTTKKIVTIDGKGTLGTGSGGATVGSGGATVGSGGANVGSGGATVGSGGANVGSGGATIGSGGGTVGSGGGTVGSGGATVETGGATVGSGGATVGNGGATVGSGGATVGSGGATVGSGGGTVGSGGATIGSGGVTVGSGGATVGSGGATVGSGGATVGNGGATVGSGGGTVGNGGATVGSGGATVGSGGATVGSGGATVGSGKATVGSGGATVGSGGATIAMTAQTGLDNLPSTVPEKSMTSNSPSNISTPNPTTTVSIESTSMKSGKPNIESTLTMTSPTSNDQTSKSVPNAAISTDTTTSKSVSTTATSTTTSLSPPSENSTTERPYVIPGYINCTCPKWCTCNDPSVTVLDSYGTLAGTQFTGNWSILCGVAKEEIISSTTPAPKPNQPPKRANGRGKRQLPTGNITNICCVLCSVGNLTNSNEDFGCSAVSNNSRLGIKDGSTEVEFDMTLTGGNCSKFPNDTYDASIENIDTCDARMMAVRENSDGTSSHEPACSILTSWTNCSQPLDIGPYNMSTSKNCTMQRKKEAKCDQTVHSCEVKCLPLYPMTCPPSTCTKNPSLFDAAGALINPGQYGAAYNACGRNFLHSPGKMSNNDGREYCCKIGMVLVEIDSQATLDCLSAAFLGKGDDWIGMVFDAQPDPTVANNQKWIWNRSGRTISAGDPLWKLGDPRASNGPAIIWTVLHVPRNKAEIEQQPAGYTDRVLCEKL